MKNGFKYLHSNLIFQKKAEMPYEPFTCPHCKSLYEMSYHEVSGFDEGNSVCEVCGKKMKEWQGHRIFSFRLLRHSNQYE